MVARLSPLWLARPSRFAGLTRTQARIGLVMVAALIALCLTALTAAAPPPATGQGRGEDRADVVLYEGIVEGVRHGGAYYDVAAAAMRSGDYPMRPFVAFPLPTLATVQGTMPWFVTIGLLYLLAFAVMLAWAKRLLPAFDRRGPVMVALVLLACGMALFVQRELVVLHEVWAALLVALSLALRRPGHWVEAVALGLAAMLIRETAALYVAIMCAAALIDGRRREAAAWAGTPAILAVVVALHAQSVAQVVGPLDPALPDGAALLGPGFFVATLAASTSLMLLPLALAAVLVGFSLVGWAAWREPLAARMLAIILAYGALLSLFGRPETFYWGFMVAPAFLIGLAFAPDGLRDLWAKARDTRRITVTRGTA